MARRSGAGTEFRLSQGLVLRRRLGPILVAVAFVGAACTGSGPVVTVPGNPDVEVTLGLQRDTEGLAAMAFEVSDPASGRFGNFLTVSEIADQFGASPDDRDAVKAFLESKGASVEVHPTGLLVTATMPAETAERLFDVTMSEGQSNSGARYLAASGELIIPNEIEGTVVEAVGLTRELGAAAPKTTASSVAVPEVDSQACTEATEALAKVHDTYGISELAAGSDGAGVRVGVTGIAAPDGVSEKVWARCLGIEPPEISLVAASTVLAPGTDKEASLDVAMLIGTAPGVDSLIFIEFDRFGWVGAPFAAALALDEPPDVLSASVGFCEQAISGPDISLAESVLAAAAVAGMTVVAATGDNGSACAADGKLGVQYPSSSAFVTAVGGTQWIMGPNGSVSGEEVWNDGTSATGGGHSDTIDRPPFQTHAGAQRRVPDLALTASASDLPAIPVCPDTACTWQMLGGTSASTPIAAGAFALIESRQKAVGGAGIGNYAPSLYTVGPTLAFFDVTIGNNRVGNVDCCDTATGNDPASGQGAPRFGSTQDGT